MNEMRQYLLKAFVQSKAKKWQDVRVPNAFLEKAHQIGLSQEETFNYAINTWNKYVTHQLTYQPIQIKENK